MRSTYLTTYLFFLLTPPLSITLAQSTDCSENNNGPYFVSVAPEASVTISTAASAAIGNDDCQLVLGGTPLETRHTRGVGYQATVDGTAIARNGPAYLTVRSRRRGTTSRPSVVWPRTRASYVSAAFDPATNSLFGLERFPNRSTRIWRIDPDTLIATAFSEPMEAPVAMAISGLGQTAWVITNDGRFVTPVSLSDGRLGTPVAMPANLAASAIWPAPLREDCFIVRRSQNVLDRPPGVDLAMYCGASELPGKLGPMDEFAVHESGGWSYNTSASQLYKVAVDANGLRLDGPSIPMNASNNRKLVVGRGKVYRDCAAYDIATGSISPMICDGVLGVDEQSGLTFVGALYRGVLAAVDNATLLRATDRADLSNVGKLFQESSVPAILAPPMDLRSLIVAGPDRLYFLGTQGTTGAALYALPLKGRSKKFTFSSAGMVNAASLTTGPLAAGEIISIFGEDIGPEDPVSVPPPVSDSVQQTSYEDWGVTFDGRAGVAFFGSKGQINVVVPTEVAGKDAVNVEIYQGLFTSPPVRATVAKASPAFFTIGEALPGAAVAVFPNGEIVGFPRKARPGDVVSLFGTGFAGPSELGYENWSTPLEPKELNRANLSVRICGKPAEIAYAGVAPGFRFGLFQFNLKIPQCESAPGGRVEVVAGISGTSSPSGVFLPFE